MARSDAARDRHWDLIVIGTGMAGATFGHALAKGGLRVLFCEMGRSLFDTPERFLGVHAETLFDRPEVPQPKHRDLLLATGRYFGEVLDVSRRRPTRHVPFIGAGTGGSSALYGGALERFFPEDFEPMAQHPGAADSTLPERWPISYGELEPFYAEAERLYRVRGTRDPLRTAGSSGTLMEPPPLSAAGGELFEFFAARGLHPYRLPQACEFVDGCDGCQGFLCPKECKNDSARICLGPALSEHGAALLDECEVVRLEAPGDAVTGVVCRRAGREITLRGELVVLAAGALETPRLLLGSASERWPDGLANGSGLIGRNLMRHYVDLYAVRTVEREDLPGNHKELAFNDLYAGGGDKLGTVQSFGALPPREVVLTELRARLEDMGLRWLAPLFPLALPVLVPYLASLRRRVVLATVMEDLPFADNRVIPAADGQGRVAIRYSVREPERRRIAAFRARVRELLRPYRFDLIKQAESNERLAHACGTCRFGDDPETSALDRWNRAHELRNLYVLDASFFPSSGGTNPALTIAANALRVADHLLRGGRSNVG